MGNEQSGQGVKNSKDDGTYSKPIGGDTITNASNPRNKLSSTGSLQSDHLPNVPYGSGGEGAAGVSSRRSASVRRATLAAAASTASSGARDIIVVHEGKKPDWAEQAPELKELSEIPIFGPLLRNSRSSGSIVTATKEIPEFGEKLDHKAILHFCLRYQEHLKQCAEAVTFDQTTLCTKIKEVDFEIKCLHDMLTERQKKYGRFTEQLNKVQEMKQVLTRSRSTAHSLAHMLDQINSSLPPDQQLEPFTFLPPLPSPPTLPNLPVSAAIASVVPPPQPQQKLASSSTSASSGQATTSDT